jgi:hypothetical protein
MAQGLRSLSLREHREREKRFCHDGSLLVRREPTTPSSLSLSDQQDKCQEIKSLISKFTTACLPCLGQRWYTQKRRQAPHLSCSWPPAHSSKRSTRHEPPPPPYPSRLPAPNQYLKNKRPLCTLLPLFPAPARNRQPGGVPNTSAQNAR